ncbi:hypothetical protein HUU39_04735 [candidate division KSB1 bacterium]|nr:hypothetical protein [bacterium]NUM64572.1 hypothetical protein [candidate division KSB1 bacterium]
MNRFVCMSVFDQNQFNELWRNCRALPRPRHCETAQGEQEGNQPSGLKINHYCRQYLCYRCGKNWLFWRIAFWAIAAICGLLFEANSVTIAQSPPAGRPLATSLPPVWPLRPISAGEFALPPLPPAQCQMPKKNSPERQ